MYVEVVQKNFTENGIDRCFKMHKATIWDCIRTIKYKWFKNGSRYIKPNKITVGKKSGARDKELSKLLKCKPDILWHAKQKIVLPWFFPWEIEWIRSMRLCSKWVIYIKKCVRDLIKQKPLICRKHVGSTDIKEVFYQWLVLTWFRLDAGSPGDLFHCLLERLVLLRQLRDLELLLNHLALHRRQTGSKKYLEKSSKLVFREFENFRLVGFFST